MIETTQNETYLNIRLLQLIGDPHNSSEIPDSLKHFNSDRKIMKNMS